MEERIKNQIKKYLSLNISDRDKDIEFYIYKITSKIKSVCHRIDIPEQLEYLVLDYAMNCTIYYSDGYGKDKNVVSSASDNGQSVYFKNVESITKDDVDLDKYITKHINELKEYSYMY